MPTTSSGASDRTPVGEPLTPGRVTKLVTIAAAAGYAGGPGPLGSWARGEQDPDVAHLAQERLTEPGAARRHVDRPRASWPPGRERLHDQFLYPCRVDRGEVDHAQ